MKVETLKRVYRDVIVEGECVPRADELVRIYSLSGPLPSDA